MNSILEISSIILILIFGKQVISYFKNHKKSFLCLAGVILMFGYVGSAFLVFL